MLRLQPSVIGVTKTEFDDFLLNHGAHRTLAMVFAKEQSQPSLPLYALPVPEMRLRRGPERSRDESLTDSTLIASSPSAAMDDRDELELEMLANDSLDISVSGSPIEGSSMYGMRRDSVLDKDDSPISRYSNNLVQHLNSIRDMQLDGAAPDAQNRQRSLETGHARLGPSSSRYGRSRRVRGSSDPGEFTPLSIPRTRPSSGLERATTTGNLAALLEDNARRTITPNWVPNTSVTPGSNDRDSLRHTARSYAIRHSDRSPLDELIADAERLNLHGLENASDRQSWSQSQRFPSFEDDNIDTGIESRTDNRLRDDRNPFAASIHVNDSSDRAGETGVRLSYDTLARLALDDLTSPSPSPVRVKTTPSAADRLLAFAVSFTPRVLQGSSLAPPLNGAPAIPSQRRSPISGKAGAPAQPSSRPLQDFAVVSGGRPLMASPRQARTSTVRRVVNPVEEVENDDDTSEVEAEASSGESELR